MEGQITGRLQATGRPQAADSLPKAYRLLLAGGTVGGLIFSATYTIEGLTRSGYDPLRQAVSELSLGSGGWVQQVNFVVFGVLACLAAIGVHAALTGGVGGTSVPILKVVSGVCFILCGVFSQDPISGPATLHGMIHNTAAGVGISALAVSCFVMARRFAREPNWRGWAAYSVVTGLLICGFMALFGWAMATHGLAGLFERLAGGSESLWGLLIVAYLLMGTGLLSSSGPGSRRSSSVARGR